MRTLTNDLRKQIEDFVTRASGFVGRNYILARASSGEVLTLKVRDEKRIRVLAGPSNNTPAMASRDAVYLSKERVVDGMDPLLMRFIIAHEVGHWVHRHQEPATAGEVVGSTRRETQADSFAMSLYGGDHGVMSLVRLEVAGMVRRADSLLTEASDMEEYKRLEPLVHMYHSRWKNLHR